MRLCFCLKTYDHIFPEVISQPLHILRGLCCFLNVHNSRLCGEILLLNTQFCFFLNIWRMCYKTISDFCLAIREITYFCTVQVLWVVILQSLFILRRTLALNILRKYLRILIFLTKIENVLKFITNFNRMYSIHLGKGKAPESVGIKLWNSLIETKVKND